MILKKEDVEKIRSTYPVGTRVEMVLMVDDPHPVLPGTFGAVKFVDDAGHVHVLWDNGRTLAFIPGVDSVRFMNAKVIVRRPDEPFHMRDWELANWANAVHKAAGGKKNVFSSTDFPERLKGHHCDCGVTDEGYSKGVFQLLPLDSEEVREGGKAYMRCDVCGGYSHL